MSSPTAITPSESSSKKPEESRVVSKEASTLNDEGIKNSVTVAKTEQPAQPPVTNGALAESEVKVVGNGLESSTNGQEEKPVSDGPHREVPALLPLGPMNPSPTTPQPSILPSLSPNPPARQPLPQLLPMNATTAPVVATKSAPPPPTTPTGKTRGRSSTASATPSPAKEQSSPGPSLRSKKEVEDQELVEEKEVKKRKVVSKKRHSVASSDSTEKGDVDSGGDGDTGRKSKRARTRTQPFQSSDMDVNLLRVIKASAAAQAAAAAQLAKANEEKLVVFFKGEFLAVRNAEGGFYICQAMQNINRGSHKIRIRWLSQTTKEDAKNKKKAKTADPPEPVKDESGFDIYTPDFYDNTDFECILTNLELEKLGRDRYGLPLDERQRTENILRRAIEVEQGVVDKLELTEEHPDGLDVSLFHDESQLKRKCDDSSSESESDSKEEVVTTSGSSGKSSQSTEPEPKTSTSGVASTSSGRGTKRTRAAAVAAARQKIQQMRYQDDDDSSDDDDADDDIEEDDSSSDSESEKRRGRGRPSPRRSRPAPAPKARANVRSARGKKLVSPAKPIPMLMKPTKASFKQSTEVPSNRRKVDHIPEKPSSPLEKVVTVDVEMGDNETSVEEEPKEIKVDAVMAVEEKKPAEETKPEIPKLTEITPPADEKVAEKTPTEPTKEVKPESKDNDKDEVKEAIPETTTKSESVAPEKESVKEKNEKEVADVKTELKVVETKE